MKCILHTILLIFLVGKAHAQLGAKLSEIRTMFPDEKLSIELEKGSNTDYASRETLAGTWVYYFDSNTHVCTLCILKPSSIASLNSLVKEYNESYVTVSDKSWKAYVDGGAITLINLRYNEEYKTYLFYFQDSEHQ